MSPQSQTQGKRASENRKANRRGLEMAGRTARRGSSESLISIEEINADLDRLDAEMAERKPRRGSSGVKFLKRRLAALEKGKEGLKGRFFWEAKDQKKKMKAMEEEEEDNARHRAMNEEGKEKNRVLNAVINLLAPALLGDSRPEGGPKFSGQ